MLFVTFYFVIKKTRISLITLSEIIEHPSIAAISTPIEEGGFAVIRVSGKDAIQKVQGCFKMKDLRTADFHTVHFGMIIKEDGCLVDEVAEA